MRHFQLKRSVVHVVIIISLCFITFFAFAGPKGKAVGHDKISPGLAKVLEYYQADKNFELPVIVQVDPDSFHPHGAPPGLVQGLVEEKVLGLVQGYSGKMSVKDIQLLEYSPFIDYVSLDASVRPTSNPFTSSIGVDQTLGSGGGASNLLGHDGAGVTVAVFDSGIADHPDLNSSYNVRDEFSVASYSNDDGQDGWATDWIESGDNNSPSSGTVLIDGGRLYMDNADSGALPSIERNTDFPGVNSAVLTFDFDAYGAGGLDIVAVEVSSNGGGSYTLLENLEIAGTVNSSRSYDLGNQISLATELSVRFRLVQGFAGPGQYVAFDNVEIQASAGSEHTYQTEASESYRDQFDSVSYSNNDGSVSWSNSWREYKDDNSATTGTIRVQEGYVHLDNSDGGTMPAVYRSVDLSGEDNAVLSFDFVGFGEGGLDIAKVQVYNGQSTADLELIEVVGNVSGSRSYQLEDFINLTSNVQIRLRLSQGFAITGQYVGFDNVQISMGGSETTFVSVDFTSGEAELSSTYNDGFGHGTHVSGIIGGKGHGSNGQYSGVAPEAEFIHLKVLDDSGIGSTSTVIQAIEWTIQNKDVYNIRVANLSLGHPAFESYLNDPLCQAARRMVEAGIVTVVSAGNLGKTADHPELWGGITSPGTEPRVITVGAANTKGTATHADDVATSYSSRGYTIPDQLFKPDLVAPGNRIPSLSVPGHIKANYPSLQIGDDYISLSGSSMATAFVSGAAAIMLDANPDLTPNLVKTILLVTATKMDQPHMFEQGNGFLNAYTAVKLAEQVDVANHDLLGDVPPMWILNGENGPEEVWAGGAFVWGQRVLYSDLVAADSGFWGDSVVWSDNLFGPESVLWADTFFNPGSVIWSDFFNSVVWADFFNSVIWADASFDPDSVVWSDFFDSVIWADFLDSVIWADNFDSVIWADFFDSVIWADFLDSVIWADYFDSVIWSDFFDSVVWADFFDSVVWADFFDSVIWADGLFDPGSVIWADFFDGVIWADNVIWTDDPANSTEGD